MYAFCQGMVMLKIPANSLNCSAQVSTLNRLQALGVERFELSRMYRERTLYLCDLQNSS